MHRRGVLGLMLASCTATAGLGGACQSNLRTGEPGPVAVQLGDTVHASNPMVAAEQYFADRVSALTHDRYRIAVVPGGVLGDDSRVNELVRTGRLAFAKTLMSNLTAYDKRLGVVNLPYAFTGRDQCLQSLTGDLGRRCAAILDEYDLVVLAYFYGGDRNVYNAKRPVHTPDDLKGMKIRVPQSIVSIDMINALGASAVPMATNDILSALRQRVVDGAENSVIFYATEQHDAPAPFFSWTRHQQSVDVLLASKRWLSAQPAGVGAAIVEAGRQTQQRELDLWTTETGARTAEIGRRGVTLDEVDIAAFQRAVAPVVDEHRGTFGDLTALLPRA